MILVFFRWLGREALRYKHRRDNRAWDGYDDYAPPVYPSDYNRAMVNAAYNQQVSDAEQYYARQIAAIRRTPIPPDDPPGYGTVTR